VELALKLAQSEYVTGNLIQSLKAVSQPSRKPQLGGYTKEHLRNDTWLFLQRNNSQRLLLCWRSAAHICHNLLILSMKTCEFSNFGHQAPDHRRDRIQSAIFERKFATKGDLDCHGSGL
jgi:hypothetical protein